jgi:hypothetical protein
VPVICANITPARFIEVPAPAVGVLLCGGDQVGHRLDRRSRRHFEHDGRGAQQADRREVLARIEGHRLVDVRVQRVGRDRAETDGVAVRRGLGHRVHADVAARAAAVVDQYRLAQLLRHLLAHGARHEVGGAAGCVGHDEADRLRRIVRRVREGEGRGQQRHSRGTARESEGALHGLNWSLRLAQQSA